jgi:cytosine/adenosine deaminase-related metal-dependent hydrolase
MTAAEVQPNPFDCPIGNLVYSGTGRLTKTVMVNGAIVMEDREFKTIERKAFWAEFNAATNSKLAAQNFHVKSPWPIN